jgi:hypothetical protein
MIMMPRTISASSLSAYSASVASTLASASTGAIPGLLPLRDGRRPWRTSAKRQLLLALPDSTTQPLPRGSLLSLQA